MAEQINGSDQQTGLRVTELGKVFPTRSEPVRVLAGVSFELAARQAMVVMGPSGAGKSTLLHIIAALEQPTAGQVLLNGVDPFVLPERQLADFRNRQVGFVFQDHHLLPQCCVLENVLIPTIPRGGSDAAAEQRARDLLDQVGLSARLDHLPAELSGGERQRVAIARALINQPALLLADEPTGNLDRTTAQSVVGLLMDLHRRAGTMLLMVTHNAEVAGHFDDRRELRDGRLRRAD